MTNWLTAAEVAERMGLSTKRICDMCATGKLPGAEIGASRKAGWRIPENAIEYAQAKPWRIKTLPPSRVCRLCGIEQPIEVFRLGTDGKRRRHECHDCERKGHRARYASDPVKYCEMVKASYRKHIDAARARQKKWREANKETLSLKSKARYDANPEKHRAIRRRWWANLTPEQRVALNEREREHKRVYMLKYPRRKLVQDNWRKRYPEKHAARQQRRVARQNNAPRIEDIDRLAIIERDNGTCYLCGVKPLGRMLCLDHVVPLSRGGTHTADNLRVACGRCNTRKGNKLLSELSWYHPPL